MVEKFRLKEPNFEVRHGGTGVGKTKPKLLISKRLCI
jgi:hypothetical protein